MHQIIQLSCHGWGTTQLLIYSKALNRHLRPFVQGTLQNHIEIFGRLLMLPLFRQKGNYTPTSHEWVQR